MFSAMLVVAALASAWGCADPSAPEDDLSADALAAPSRAAGAPYPIVLLHGGLGFREVEVGPFEMKYFTDIPEDLRASGESVFVTEVAPADTSEERIKSLAKQVDEILVKTGKAKVNLIGHSQGGMDARALASPNGGRYGAKIASITTLGTPHRGTRVGDALAGFLNVPFADFVVERFVSFLQATLYAEPGEADLRAAAADVSEHQSAAFNARYNDAPGVAYMSYASRTNKRTASTLCANARFGNDTADVDPAQPLIAPIAMFLEEGKAKPNDGFVTVESQIYGTLMECPATDHLKEVGIEGPGAQAYDHKALWRRIVSRLRADGF